VDAARIEVVSCEQNRVDRILVLNAEHAGAKRRMRRAGISNDDQPQMIVVNRKLGLPRSAAVTNSAAASTLVFLLLGLLFRGFLRR